jgi:hypothetical protein
MLQCPIPQPQYDVFTQRDELAKRAQDTIGLAGMHGIACASSNFELFGRILCAQPVNDPLV